MMIGKRFDAVCCWLFIIDPPYTNPFMLWSMEKEAGSKWWRNC